MQLLLRYLLLAPALSVVAYAGAVAFAQAPAAAWFGLPPPGPVTGQVLDFKTTLPPIPPPSAKNAPDLDGQKAMQYVRDVVGFSQQSRDAGEKTWGRLAGSRWAEMTTDYVAGKFREAGLQDIRKETVTFVNPMPIAVDWKVTVLAAPDFGAGSGDITLQSAYPMTIRRAGGPARGGGPAGAGGPPASPAGTWQVTAPVAYVGAGTAADFATADLKGKIAIFQVEPAPAAFFGGAGRAAQQAIANGAVGVLAIYNAPGNVQLYLGTCTNAPCFNLGGEDGDFLNAVIAKAVAANALDKLRISMTVTQNVMNGPAHALVAKIAGKSSAENLVVLAHSDAWFAGANDNASGIAALIALARHYAKGPKPNHDIYFYVSPGHHSPTGGTRRLVELYPNIGRTNIVALNLEHIAQQGTYRSSIAPRTSKYGTVQSRWLPVNWDSPGREVAVRPSTPMLRRVITDAARRTQFTAVGEIGVAPAAELDAIIKAGALGIQDVETSMWFHTSGDTIETVSPQTLQRALFFYKDILDQSDKLSHAQMHAGAPTAVAGSGEDDH
jgi:Peptidase family M28